MNFSIKPLTLGIMLAGGGMVALLWQLGRHAGYIVSADEINQRRVDLTLAAAKIRQEVSGTQGRIRLRSVLHPNESAPYLVQGSPALCLYGTRNDLAGNEKIRVHLPDNTTLNGINILEAQTEFTFTKGLTEARAGELYTLLSSANPVTDDLSDMICSQVIQLLYP